MEKRKEGQLDVTPVDIEILEAGAGHTHKGVECEAGDIITVKKYQADNLIGEKRAVTSNKKAPANV